MPHKQYATLTQHRDNLSARASIDAIVNYAREQDRRVSISRSRYNRAGLLLRLLLIAPPVIYVTWHATMGSWRSIYSTSFTQSFGEVPQNRLREYFVPEIYLKEREKRKIEIKLKQTEELREIWHKQ